MLFKAAKVDDSKLEAADSIALRYNSPLSSQVGGIFSIGLKIGYAALQV